MPLSKTVGRCWFLAASFLAMEKTWRQARLIFHAPQFNIAARSSLPQDATFLTSHQTIDSEDVAQVCLAQAAPFQSPSAQLSINRLFPMNFLILSWIAPLRSSILCWMATLLIRAIPHPHLSE